VAEVHVLRRVADAVGEPWQQLGGEQGALLLRRAEQERAQLAQPLPFVGGEQRGFAGAEPLALLRGQSLVFEGELDLDELAARVALVSQQVGVGAVRRQVVGVCLKGVLHRVAQLVAHGEILPGSCHLDA
jgi:hypothetical protein